MTSDEARKYLDGSISVNDLSQQVEDTSNVNPDSAVSSTQAETTEEKQLEETSTEQQGSTEQVATEEVHTETPEEVKPKPEEKEEKTPENKDKKGLPYPKGPTNGDKKRMSAEELKEFKANEAFIRQKRKYQAKVGAMQTEIDNLKQQLLKFNAVDPETLKDKPEEMMDLKINKSTLDNQIKLLEKQRNEAIEEQANAEAQLIHQQRIEKCFTDEAEVNRYQTLLANGRDKFFNFLQKYDPENTILQYLDDSDHSPLLVQVLMTNPNVLKKVVEIRNPLNKTIELRSLENRIVMDRKLRQVKGKPAAPAAKKLPSTGSQVGAGAGSDKSAVRDSNYWRNYLQTH